MLDSAQPFPCTVHVEQDVVSCQIVIYCRYSIRQKCFSSATYDKLTVTSQLADNSTTMVQSGHAVAVAFALNIAAGAATILGGMVVFSKRLVYLANPLSLAVALSISSGVMMFISLVEIFGESVHLLTEGIQTEDMSEETATGHGWLSATACFALGIALIYTFANRCINSKAMVRVCRHTIKFQTLSRQVTRSRWTRTQEGPAAHGCAKRSCIGIHNLPEESQPTSVPSKTPLSDSPSLLVSVCTTSPKASPSLPHLLRHWFSMAWNHVVRDFRGGGADRWSHRVAGDW
ncbi:hypothetical protein GQ600_1961 [Phytophthora cactorum]|nr:hypothetical protein GQ600_1961 [Phytophthora cactorum]